MDDIGIIRRRIKRGGMLLRDVINRSNGTLSGEDMLLLHNTYAISLETIAMIAASHCMEVDETVFTELKNEQNRQRYILCPRSTKSLETDSKLKVNDV